MYASGSRSSAALGRFLISGILSRVAVVSSSASFSTVSSSCLSRQFIPVAIGASLSSRALCSIGRGSSEDEESEKMPGSEQINNGPPTVVQAKGQHKASVIFLHGLGDQGHGWADAFKHEIRHDNIKYICPHSANRGVTLNMGMNMPAWYDLFGLDALAREDDSGIVAAARYVHQLIDAEIAAGIPANKICVGGFSMGGALAIYAGLTYTQKLGGIIGMSSFFLQRSKFPGSHTANLQTPIFLGHGSMDFLVPLPIGQMSESLIKKFNPNVQFHTYSMAHSSCPEEMRDVKKFLTEKLKL